MNQIHGNLFRLIKNNFKFDISHLKILESDTSIEILKKVRILSLVTEHPDYYMILKKSKEGLK